MDSRNSNRDLVLNARDFINDDDNIDAVQKEATAMFNSTDEFGDLDFNYQQ